MASIPMDARGRSRIRTEGLHVRFFVPLHRLLRLRRRLYTRLARL
jgi:hypothetical protein